MTDMACDHARLLLSHQVDGGLNLLEATALNRHLEQCRECRASAEAFWIQDRQLMELHAAPVVEELAMRIRRKLNRPQPLLRSPRRVATVLLVAATVLMLAVGIPRMQRQANVDRLVPATGTPESNQVVSGDVLVDGEQTQTLGDGAIVQVVGERPAVVRLTDGSEAEFEPGTTALVHGRETGRRPWIELNEGSGTFRVEKAKGEFQVTTHLGRVTALGTEFSVGLLPSHTSGDLTMKMRSAMLAVAVLSGMVQVEFNQETFTLGGGESRVFGQERGAAPAAEGQRDNAAPGRGAREAAQGGRRDSRAFEVRGTVSAVDKTKVTLTTRGGPVDYELSSEVAVTVDGKPAKLDDILAGMIVALERKEELGPVIAVKAEGPTIGGEVKSLAADQKSITISTTTGRREGNTEQTYALADDVVVTSGRETVKVSELLPGTPVALKLSVDKKTVLSVTRVQPRVEGDNARPRGERGAPEAKPEPGRGR